MRFAEKTVAVIGATGGLGTAIARAFAAEGAALALAGRSRLSDVDVAGSAVVSRHKADLTDPDSLAALRADVLAAHGRVDVVVNATGHDVRKSLFEHTLDDFHHTLDVNLLGAMLLTQTFLPVMGDGVIVHLGGFADGRLAFPFYSADAASHAGLRAFAEAANRELALAGRPAVVSFFSPGPADTEAERPFHPLWRELGTAIVSPDKVAGELVKAVDRREKVHIMGGWTTRFVAALNAVSPRLADALLLKRYAATMGRFFGRPDAEESGSAAGAPSVQVGSNARHSADRALFSRVRRSPRPALPTAGHQGEAGAGAGAGGCGRGDFLDRWPVCRQRADHTLQAVFEPVLLDLQAGWPGMSPCSQTAASAGTRKLPYQNVLNHDTAS